MSLTVTEFESEGEDGRAIALAGVLTLEHGDPEHPDRIVLDQAVHLVEVLLALVDALAQGPDREVLTDATRARLEHATATLVRVTARRVAR